MEAEERMTPVSRTPGGARRHSELDLEKIAKYDRIIEVRG
jgi:hypothetical protein